MPYPLEPLARLVGEGRHAGGRQDRPGYEVDGLRALGIEARG